ncbi:chitobiase/beta-hexosaminidase C-terminal domain-containing protein [Aestuariibaculum sediminum]|uniref:Chitobiase/beta-hexosaminidase C-terminal domain-containing protein n=1 Tax=Aestuariibaculum sediminum TaxID=2770637 RepID=A0A8J6Q2L2_9FLAO|nr:chitobiase/beta-hexosaminidase C-terminal domain-containing protein [Aestuariibaculum sediminum]MBD0831910.1 chitobiase/beta-hexosaminidase C-terminal domain-containing protein [Aestuariibaculum sediminum]
MRLVIWIFCLLLMNCASKENKAYLQSKEVQLVQPRVIANSVLVDSFVIIKASLKVDGTTIFYTSNGDMPNESSNKYQDPIKVSNPGLYRFRAYHPDWKSSDIAELKIYKKGKQAESIIWHTQASNKYPGLGEKTVINENKGLLNFTDAQWVGFDTLASATVCFKEKTYLKSVDISFLIDTGSWIFPPEEVSVIINGDAESMKTIQLNKTESSSEISNKTIKIPLETEVKTLKINVQNIRSIPEWHEGRGTSAWLFMDEWLFN